jgi:hypothetical protein
MTPIRKTVRRRTVGTYRGRRIIVAIHAGDVLGFREERTRREFLLSISGAYTYAVRLAVAARQREKAEARKARKGGRCYP